MYRSGGKLLAPALGIMALGLGSQDLHAGFVFQQTNLVSDIPGLAANTDPDLVNPWGLVHSATSPFWVADNHSGVSTLYNGSGSKLGLIVTVPPPLGGVPPAAPTGIVFNGSTDFQVAANAPARFIFSTEDGTISGWNSGTSAILEADKSASGAVYKGLAIGNNGSGNFLYASNFNSGAVDVFDKNFAPTSLAGAFVDPSIPAGYAPFNIQNINGKLYVTYAKQNGAKHDDVAGPGNGYVDVYDLNGNFLQRLASNGPLNSPWGLTLAPAGFGNFGGDLLVGNFGDGTIDVFNAASGSFIDVLKDKNGNAIDIPGLWGLEFGNGASGGNVNTLYFTAGIPGPDALEDHGLFGSIDAKAVPDSASTAALLGLACVGLYAARRVRRAI